MSFNDNVHIKLRHLKKQLSLQHLPTNLWGIPLHWDHGDGTCSEKE